MAVFIGNVLPDMTRVRGEDDVSFDFNEEEARKLDLKGIPIRIEHEEGLAVGRVLRSWNGKNGEKWVMGKLNDDTMESRFASYMIKPGQITGHTLYKGLSLQHVWRGHKASNGALVGRGEKRPIEISICVDPRRPNCYITHVASTSKMEYKAPPEQKYTMASEAPPAPVESTPAETPATEAPAAEAPPAESADVDMSRENLMRAFVDQESEMAELKQKLEQAQKQNKQLAEQEQQRLEQEKQRRENEILQQRTKAEGLSRALIDTWTSQLNPEDMTDDVKKAVFALAEKFPQESVKMMEIAHKASKRSAELERELERARQNAERKNLENQVAAVLSKKRARTIPQVEQEIHRASKRSATQSARAQAQAATNPFLAPSISKTADSIRSSNPQLFEALAAMGRGSARSSMDAIANLMK